MSTFSATANSSSTIGYAQCGSSSWSTGSSNGACQGAYKGTTAAKSRVGVMVFNNAGATLKYRAQRARAIRAADRQPGRKGFQRDVQRRDICKEIWATPEAGGTGGADARGDKKKCKS